MNSGTITKKCCLLLPPLLPPLAAAASLLAAAAAVASQYLAHNIARACLVICRGRSSKVGERH